MSQQELLAKVLETLERHGIDYMVTGSLASSFQGEPRMTHNVDILIAIRKEQIADLTREFQPPVYYLDEKSACDALAARSMFNLIEVAEDDKVDFWILTDSEFDQSRFARKRTEDVLGLRIKMSTPEDTILAKLRWAEKSGGSEKHFNDALRVFEVQCKNLDQEYMDHWAAQMRIEQLLARLRNESEPI